MRDEFIRFQKFKNRVALRFRVRCVSTFKAVRVSCIPDWKTIGRNKQLKLTDQLHKLLIFHSKTLLPVWMFMPVFGLITFSALKTRFSPEVHVFKHAQSAERISAVKVSFLVRGSENFQTAWIETL